MGHLSNKEYFTTTTLIFKLKDVFQENVKNKVTSFQHKWNLSPKYHQDPVVRRPISTNLELNFYPGFFFFHLKAFSGTIFSILLGASN